MELWSYIEYSVLALTYNNKTARTGQLLHHHCFWLQVAEQRENGTSVCWLRYSHDYGMNCRKLQPRGYSTTHTRAHHFKPSTAAYTLDAQSLEWAPSGGRIGHMCVH